MLQNIKINDKFILNIKITVKSCRVFRISCRPMTYRETTVKHNLQTIITFCRKVFSARKLYRIAIICSHSRTCTFALFPHQMILDGSQCFCSSVDECFCWAMLNCRVYRSGVSFLYITGTPAREMETFTFGRFTVSRLASRTVLSTHIRILFCEMTGLYYLR